MKLVDTLAFNDFSRCRCLNFNKKNHLKINIPIHCPSTTKLGKVHLEHHCPYYLGLLPHNSYHGA
jgi:hypothetical protein